MSVNKSIIETFELEDSTEVYIQSGIFKDIALSFDGKQSQFMQRLPLNDAEKLVAKLKQVIKEAKENGAN